MSSFEFEQHSRYCCLRFHSELTGMNWDQIEAASNEAMRLVRQASPPAVVIDLTSVSALPEGFIALLVRVWRQLHSDKRRLVVVATHDDVRGELKRAGVDSLWTPMDSVERAGQMLDDADMPAVPDDRRSTDAKSFGQPSPESSTSATIIAASSAGAAGSSAAAPATASNAPIEFEDQRGFCTVRLNPVLMSLSWSEVESETTDAINKIKQSKNNAVMVDMAAMETINSGLVASLVRIWKTMQQRKGRFSLVSSNEMVTDVLKTAGLWKLWTIVDERDEAVYQLGAGKVAEVEQRERRVLALVAVPCALLSLLAFAYMHASESLSAAVNAQVTSLLLAAAALATGLLSVFKDAGVRRYLSVGAVVVSAGVLAASQLQTNPIGAVSNYLNEVTDGGDAVGGRWRRTDGIVDEAPDESDQDERKSDDPNSDSVATDDESADGDRPPGPSDAQAKPIADADAQTAADPTEPQGSPGDTPAESTTTTTNLTETNADDVKPGGSEGDVIGADEPLP